MGSNSRTIDALKKARKFAIDNAVKAKTLANLKEKAEWELKRAYIDDQISKFEKITGDMVIPKRVFISYSKSTGQDYFDYLKRMLEENGFEILDGFSRISDTEGNVLRRVLSNLNKSTVYVGILTGDMEIVTGKKKKISYKYVPSVWTMEEKGMALASDKPFVLLIDERIHEDFWQKTAGHKQHVKFKDSADFYNNKCNDLVNEVIDRYEEVALKYVQDN